MHSGRYIRNLKKSHILKDSSATSIKDSSKYRCNLNLPSQTKEGNSELKYNNNTNTIENNDFKENNKKLRSSKTNIFNISKTLTTFRSMSKADIKDTENDKQKEQIKEKEDNNQTDNTFNNNTEKRRRINFRERLNNSRKKRAFFNNNNQNDNNEKDNNPVQNQEKEKETKTIKNEIKKKNMLSRNDFSEKRKKKSIETIKKNIDVDDIINEEKEIEKEKINIVEKDIKEENLGNEIKDTVKCKMCLQKMVHPKMCPKCQNISCEKCLYNWFLREQNKECNYCKEPINFYEYISVPFMDTIVDFVEKVIYDRKKFSSSFQNTYDFNLNNNKNEEIFTNDNLTNLNDNCEIHNKEKIYYFCLNCNKGYCKTCFVFFGKEKDRHINHKIIEYSNYKKLNLSLLKQKEEEIDINTKYLNDMVSQCNSYKQVYLFEQKTINDFFLLMQKEYNKKMDEIIENINSKINELNQSLEIYQKTKKEIDDFYKKITVKNRITTNIQYLIDKIDKINYDKNIFNQLLIEPENINLKVYKSKNEEFNSKNKYLNQKINFENDFEMIADNKLNNYININLSIPKDNNKHFYKVFIYYKDKESNKINEYLLDDLKEGKNYYSFGKIIQLDESESINFEIKSIIYDFYFE